MTISPRTSEWGCARSSDIKTLTNSGLSTLMLFGTVFSLHVGLVFVFRIFLRGMASMITIRLLVYQLSILPNFLIQFATCFVAPRNLAYFRRPSMSTLYSHITMLLTIVPKCNLQAFAIRDHVTSPGQSLLVYNCLFPFAWSSKNHELPVQQPPNPPRLFLSLALEFKPLIRRIAKRFVWNHSLSGSHSLTLTLTLSDQGRLHSSLRRQGG